MTASKAMGALGLMNTRALEHPITGTQFLQEKVGSMNFLWMRFLLLKPYRRHLLTYISQSGGGNRIWVEFIFISDSRSDPGVRKQETKCY